MTMSQKEALTAVHELRRAYAGVVGCTRYHDALRVVLNMAERSTEPRPGESTEKQQTVHYALEERANTAIRERDTAIARAEAAEKELAEAREQLDAGAVGLWQEAQVLRHHLATAERERGEARAHGEGQHKMAMKWRERAQRAEAARATHETVREVLRWADAWLDVRDGIGATAVSDKGHVLHNLGVSAASWRTAGRPGLEDAGEEPDNLDRLGRPHTLNHAGECVAWCDACRRNIERGLNPDGTPTESTPAEGGPHRFIGPRADARATPPPTDTEEPHVLGRPAEVTSWLDSVADIAVDRPPPYRSHPGGDRWQLKKKDRRLCACGTASMVAVASISRISASSSQWLSAWRGRRRQRPRWNATRSRGVLTFVRDRWKAMHWLKRSALSPIPKVTNDDQADGYRSTPREASKTPRGRGVLG